MIKLLKIAGSCLLILVIAAGIWLFALEKLSEPTSGIKSADTANPADKPVPAVTEASSSGTATAPTGSADNAVKDQGEQASTPYHSIPIMPGVWEITDGTPDKPANVDIYLVAGTERSLVIDAGFSGADLAGFVKTLTDKPAELVLTHGHGDHTAAVGQFDKVSMSSKDFNLMYNRMFSDFASSGITDLKGGEVFDLGGCKLEVLMLPGHTPGSVVLLDRERQLLFAGDGMGSGSLWMQLAESTSVEEFRDEIRKLEKSLEGLNNLKPYLGHNCLMGTKPDRNYITDTRIAAEKIVSGELVGTPSGRSDYPGSITTSYGQMTDFLYRPEKIRKKGE